MDVSRLRRLALPAVVYGVILLLSSIPGSSISELGLPDALSYVGHGIEYGLFGAALAWASVGGGGDSREAGRIVLAVAIVVAILGGVDELYQGTVPGRQTSLLDLGVDVVAATLASAVVSRRMAER